MSSFPVACLRACLALVLLHLLLAFRLPWERWGEVREWLRVSADLPLLVGCAAALTLWRGERRLLAHGMTCAVLLLVIWHVAGSMVPTFYGKEFEPYHDVLLIPGLVHLLTHQLDAWLQVVAFVAAALAALAVYGLVWLTQRMLVRAASVPRVGLCMLALTQALVVAGWVDASSRAPERASRWFHASLAQDVLHHAGMALRGGWRTESVFDERVATAKQALARTPTDLAHLRETDVFVIFVESYGRGILAMPQRDAFVAKLAAHAERLREKGFAAASASLAPSIRGGMSSLAHAELLTGVQIENRRIFDLLLKSDVTALGKLFAAAGHHTVNVQPAMPREWPEGKFFGFERDLFRPSLPYVGHQYPWGDMPDQFALKVLLREVVRRSEKPVFAMFVSVTSHAPFSEVPPYYEDWEAAAAPGAFERPPERRFPIQWTNYTDHPQLPEAYLATIEYALRCAFGFTERLPRKSLVIVLGDHQPPLAGEYARRDPSHDVPIHVLSQDPKLLAPFLEHGFVSGLVPDAKQPAFPSERFLTRFLRWFSWR